MTIVVKCSHEVCSRSADGNMALNLSGANAAGLPGHYFTARGNQTRIQPWPRLAYR